MTTRAITLLMQRLYDRGHRHISFLGVPHSDVTTGAAISPTSPSAKSIV
jgi:DNA-binding LacI/PurR family transcriptional regulator